MSNHKAVTRFLVIAAFLAVFTVVAACLCACSAPVFERRGGRPSRVDDGPAYVNYPNRNPASVPQRTLYVDAKGQIWQVNVVKTRFGPAK